jgi:delta 1-pyrroline-5-carboxylate dehydrogenase
MQQIANAIAGRAAPSSSGRVSAVFNPATGEQTAELGLSNAAEVDRAVQAAKAAAPEWGRTAPLKRARLMFKFKELSTATLPTSPARSRASMARRMPTRSVKWLAASKSSNSPAASRIS